MKNPPTISSGESDERALQYLEALDCLNSVMRAASHVLVGLPPSEKEAKLRDVLSKAHDWYMAERAALATQPAESKACASVGEPADKELWQIAFNAFEETFDKKESIRDAWQRVAERVLASRFATPPAAPAATEAPSKPFAYYIHIAAEQRGEFVHDLDEALDDLTNCECKITELFDHATPAPAVGARLSDEQIDASARHHNGELDDGMWMLPVEDFRRLVRGVAAPASVQPAAGALPPVRWWSGVVGSPEKLANLLDGYSEKKESPRRDERVMRAAAKWIREVVASVQPVLASLSDEPVRLALDALEEIALAGMSGTGQESEEGMQAWHARRAWDFIGIAARARDEVRAALASSTPTKGGEAS